MFTYTSSSHTAFYNFALNTFCWMGGLNKGLDRVVSKQVTWCFMPVKGGKESRILSLSQFRFSVALRPQRP